MIPNNMEVLDKVEETTYPSRTYRIAITFDGSDRISGYTDGRDAVQQAIYLILNTERYKFIIYSWNYGVELVDLMGKPMPYVIAELPRRIKEALFQDDRIIDVNNFTFEVKRSRLYTTFTVTTIYGDLPTQLEVTI